LNVIILDKFDLHLGDLRRFKIARWWKIFCSGTMRAVAHCQSSDANQFCRVTWIVACSWQWQPF